MAVSVIASSKVIGAGFSNHWSGWSRSWSWSCFRIFTSSYRAQSNEKDALFRYAILGFALTEAVGLLALIDGILNILWLIKVNIFYCFTKGFRFHSRATNERSYFFTPPRVATFIRSRS
jgi:hypothetical protein